MYERRCERIFSARFSDSCRCTEVYTVLACPLKINPLFTEDTVRHFVKKQKRGLTTALVLRVEGLGPVKGNKSEADLLQPQTL